MSHTIQALSPTSLILPAAKVNLAKAMAAATNKASGTSSSSGSSSSTSGTSDLGTTFINLLATELQNQDPTAPVDSTAMVGQMISLNQLDQLVSINQTLSGTTSSTAATAGSASSPASPKVADASAGSAAQSATLNPAALLASTQASLPFDPNTLMPLTTSTSTMNTTSISGAK